MRINVSNASYFSIVYVYYAIIIIYLFDRKETPSVQDCNATIKNSRNVMTRAFHFYLYPCNAVTRFFLLSILRCYCLDYIMYFLGTYIYTCLCMFTRVCERHVSGALILDNIGYLFNYKNVMCRLSEMSLVRLR